MAGKVDALFNKLVSDGKIEHGGTALRKIKYKGTNWEHENDDKFKHDYANKNALIKSSNPSSWLIFWNETRHLMMAQNRGAFSHDYVSLASC